MDTKQFMELMFSVAWRPGHLRVQSGVYSAWASLIGSLDNAGMHQNLAVSNGILFG